jgi:hypothetical protein
VKKEVKGKQVVMNYEKKNYIKELFRELEKRIIQRTGKEYDLEYDSKLNEIRIEKKIKGKESTLLYLINFPHYREYKGNDKIVQVYVALRYSKYYAKEEYLLKAKERIDRSMKRGKFEGFHLGVCYGKNEYVLSPMMGREYNILISRSYDEMYREIQEYGRSLKKRYLGLLENMISLL